MSPSQDWWLAAGVQDDPTNKPALTLQSASLPATTLLGSMPQPGRYSVSWYVVVTQPDGVSSALQVTVNWNDGVAQSKSGANLTGNTTNTFEGFRQEIYCAAGSAISIQTAWSSGGGGPVMQYSLYARVEFVGA